MITHTICSGDKLVAVQEVHGVLKGEIITVNKFVTDSQKYGGETMMYGTLADGKEVVVALEFVRAYFDVHESPLQARLMFEEKRAKYLIRAAEKGEWVQLGKGDVEMLKKLL